MQQQLPVRSSYGKKGIRSSDSLETFSLTNYLAAYSWGVASPGGLFSRHAWVLNILEDPKVRSEHLLVPSVR